MFKSFQKGSSTYVCTSCGKRTRHVDPDNVSDDTCDDCYEWQGWDNAHSMVATRRTTTPGFPRTARCANTSCFTGTRKSTRTAPAAVSLCM